MCLSMYVGLDIGSVGRVCMPYLELCTVIRSHFVQNQGGGGGVWCITPTLREEGGGEIGGAVYYTNFESLTLVGHVMHALCV